MGCGWHCQAAWLSSKLGEEEEPRSRLQELPGLGQGGRWGGSLWIVHTRALMERALDS